MNHVGIRLGGREVGGGEGKVGAGEEGGWGEGYPHESWNSFHGQTFTLLQHTRCWSERSYFVPLTLTERHRQRWRNCSVARTS